MTIQQPIQYTGQDTHATSPRELLGWYSYGLAAEVFAVVGPGSFLPVTLEQLARENGVLRSDGKTPCIQTSSVNTRGLQMRDTGQCIVYIFGAEINTSSFALYSFSLAVLIQALILVSIGAIADYGANRKRLLLIFGYTGAAASALFIFVFPAIYLVGVVLTITSIACLGASFVLLNSFLPLLAANHPSTHDNTEGASVLLNSVHDDEEEDLFEDDYITNGLLNNTQFDHRQTKTVSSALALSNRISSKGVGIGYAAAVFVQFISIGIIVLYSKLAPTLASSTVPMRTVLFVVGLWWAVFMIPTTLWLRSRPGPPLPRENLRGGHFVWLHYVIFAWKSLWKTVKIAVQLRQVMIYLVGWFLLSDGIATIGGTAILFARTELQLSTVAIAMLSMTATGSGVVGAAAWPVIEKRYGLKSITVILICVALYEFIPLYGLVGFLPFVQSLGVGGLQQPWEIFPLAFILGFVMGGISSYCRSVYGLMIPPGMEASFYALFAITDKGSSVIGPAIVGRIVDATGSIRMGFWFLSVLMILPVPFFWSVNVEKGREDGLLMAEVIRQHSAETTE